MTFFNLFLVLVGFFGFAAYYKRAFRSNARKVSVSKVAAASNDKFFHLDTRIDDCEGNMIPINDVSMG